MTQLNRHITLLLGILLALANGMALDWQKNGAHRWVDLAAAGGGKPGFTLMNPAYTGVQLSLIHI